MRRARRFVLNSMVTVGNYDYAFRWYLHLDGSIECEVQLHGIVSTMALAPGEQPAGSTVVDRGLAAPNHQHFFCFRLDLDVDGVANSVREVEAESVPTGAGNPLGNAFRARVTPLARESLARRDSDERAARVWHVVNPNRRNALGGEVGYRLVPRHGVSTMLAQPDARVSQRAGFARHTLWVTRHDEAERHPSGRYPYGQTETVGLPQWSEADRPLDDCDVVLWYTVGTTHFVRPEDWPIMPVAQCRLPARARRILRPQPDAGRPAAACLPRRESRRLDVGRDLAERAADGAAEASERDEDADRNNSEHDGVFRHRLTSVALQHQVQLDRQIVEQLGPPPDRGHSLPAVRETRVYVGTAQNGAVRYPPDEGGQARRPTRGKRSSGKVSTCGERCWWSTPPST